MSTFRVDTLVIGAGAVGLSISRSLLQPRRARGNKSLLLIERNQKFGMETSSRNSSVIHAGLYYPKDSLKTELCIKGKHLLYSYAAANNIPFKQVGKWIVPSSPSQQSRLESIFKHATDLDVPVSLLSREKASGMEPLLHIPSDVLVSPSTGIVDVVSYMASLENDVKNLGGDVSYNSTLVGYTYNPHTKTFTSQITTNGETVSIESDILINASGLSAHQFSPHLKDVYFCKGHYFALRSGRGKVGRLVYPLPDPLGTSLGFHLTLDLEGSIRFGPDVYFQDGLDYAFRPDTQVHLEEAVAAIQQYMPGVRAQDLVTDYTGIRPKITPPGSKAADFFIGIGEDGFVDLVGIESPGLTSSLAIGEYVADKLYS